MFRRLETRIWVIYFAIVAGMAARLADCFFHNPLDYLFSDPHRHWLNGLRIWAPDMMGASDPIAYQCFVYLMQLATAGNRLGVALCVGLMSAAMPYLYYRAARELGMVRTRALILWAVICWTPSLFVIYHYFAMETLLLVLVGAGLWSTGRYLRKGSSSCWWQCCVIWTLCALTKPTVVPLIATCLGYAWWHKSRSLRDALISVAITAILLLPNGIRTQRFLHFPAPLGNPWITKIQHLSGTKTIQIQWGHGRWGFSSPSCYTRPLEPVSGWMMSRAKGDSQIEIKVDPERGERDWAAAYAGIASSFGERATLRWENLTLFLFSPSWPDSNVHEFDGMMNFVTRWAWAPLIFFVLFCNLQNFVAGRFCLVSLAATVFTLFLALQNVATMEGRYRKPLEPLLLLNLVWILPGSRSGERRESHKIVA